MPRVRVGIDLAKVSDTAQAMESFGDRYLTNLFTESELADCRAKGAGQAASLAARFAAKEALLKALQADPDAAPGWTTMEVVTLPSGAPELRLHRESAVLAATLGVTSLSVSLTHEGDYASAVVVAYCEDPPD